MLSAAANPALEHYTLIDMRLVSAFFCLMACATITHFGCQPSESRTGSVQARSGPDHRDPVSRRSAALAPVAWSSFLPCPRGRWRLTSEEALRDVFVPLAHVFIAHDEAPFAGKVSWSVGDWRSESPPRRSRAEAWQFAAWIAERARREPDSFSLLARKFSDDATTRDHGGSLGLFRIFGHHLLHPAVLDCIASIDEGEVSPVVESQHGFHVLRKLPPPLPMTVSGQEIVIGHRSAPWLATATGEPVPNRSREQALGIARELRQRLRKGPVGFEEAVRRYSDHPGRVRSGDLGQWSTEHTTPLSREMTLLTALEVGEVSDPLETVFGVKILRRTPNRPRNTYSAEVVQLSFPAYAANRKAATRQKAEELLARVRSDPGLFPTFQKKHCCTGVRTWEEGHRWPRLTVAVAALQVGQIASHVIRSESAFVIAKRVPSRRLKRDKLAGRLPDPR